MRGLSGLACGEHIVGRFYSGETDNGSRAPTDKLPAWPPSVLRMIVTDKQLDPSQSTLVQISPETLANAPPLH